MNYPDYIKSRAEHGNATTCRSTSWKRGGGAVQQEAIPGENVPTRAAVSLCSGALREGQNHRRGSYGGCRWPYISCGARNRAAADRPVSARPKNRPAAGLTTSQRRIPSHRAQALTGTGNPARRPCPRDRENEQRKTTFAATGPRHGRSTDRMGPLTAHAGLARVGRRGTVGCLGLPYGRTSTAGLGA